jgi:hypothetical protein
VWPAAGRKGTISSATTAGAIRPSFPTQFAPPLVATRGVVANGTVWRRGTRGQSRAAAEIQLRPSPCPGSSGGASSSRRRSAPSRHCFGRAILHYLVGVSLMLLHLLKTCIRNLSLLFTSFFTLPLENLHQEPFPAIYFFFHPPTCLETTMPTVSRVRIFTRWRLVFLSCQKLPSFLPNC